MPDNINQVLEQAVADLVSVMKSRFAQPKYIPGCEVLDISGKDDYNPDNGWVEMFCAQHNQQPVRYRGYPASIEVGDKVDVLYFPDRSAFEVKGAGGTAANGLDEVKVSKLWTSNGAEVAWQTNAGGNLANIDGETITVNDPSPTARIVVDPGSAVLPAFLKMFSATGEERLELRGYTLTTQPIVKFTKAGLNVTQLLFTVEIPGTDPSLTWNSVNGMFQWNKGHSIDDSTPIKRIQLLPGTPTTASIFTAYDEVGSARVTINSGTNVGSASTIQFFDQTGETRFFIDSDGNLIGRDDGGNARIDWSTGLAVGDATLTLNDTVSDKVVLSSNGVIQANEVTNLIDTSYLGLSGGNSLNSGANIELYGGTHATLANRAYYDADLHTFRAQAGTPTKFIIDHTSNYSRFFHSVGIQSVPLRLLHVGAGTDAPFQVYEGIYVAIDGIAQIAIRNNTDNVEGGMFAHSNLNLYMGSWTNNNVHIRTNNADAVIISTLGFMSLGAILPAVPLHIRKEVSGEIARFESTSATSNPFITFYQLGTRRGYIQLANSDKRLQLVSEFGPVLLWSQANLIDVRPSSSDFGLIVRESDGTGIAAYANFYVVDPAAANDYLNIRVTNNSASPGLVVHQGDTVSIGTFTKTASVILELASTTGALLLPRMTTTQRNALTAVDGMIIFNTTTGKVEGREGGAWVDI